MTGNSQNFARIKLGIKLISDSVILQINVIEIKSKPKTRKIKMELEGGSDVEIVNRIPKKEIKCEGDAPIPSTSTQHLIPASLGQIPGQIEIDWSALSQQLFQHLRATAEGPEKSNVPVKWIPSNQGTEIAVPEKVTKVEPPEPEVEPPEPEASQDDEDIIQILDAHMLLGSPTKTPTRDRSPDSGVGENPTQGQTIRDQVMQDSDSANDGVEEVGLSSSSQEESTTTQTNRGTTEQKTTRNDTSFLSICQHWRTKTMPKIPLNFPIKFPL